MKHSGQLDSSVTPLFWYLFLSYRGCKDLKCKITISLYKLYTKMFITTVMITLVTILPLYIPGLCFLLYVPLHWIKDTQPDFSFSIILCHQVHSLLPNLVRTYVILPN